MRLAFVLPALLFALCPTSAARAQSAAPRALPAAHDDDEPIDPRRAVPEPAAASAAAPDLWLSVGGALAMREAGREVGAMVALGGTFDLASLSEARLASGPRGSEDDPDADQADEDAGRDGERPRPAPAGPLARGAVRAALVRARAGPRRDELEGLSTRARASGIVPELRLRLAHALDEDQSLSPTEYDPDRITASGGTSLWIEGRATFRLDRLVFAGEEVAIERLRSEQARAERAIERDVVRAIGSWQAAQVLLSDPDATEAARVRAEIDAAVSEAELDVLTDGWFSEERARQMKLSERRRRLVAVPTSPSGSVMVSVTSTSLPSSDSMGCASSSNRNLSP
jgi:hypothetical protein